jgi:hypothetical protein
MPLFRELRQMSGAEGNVDANISPVPEILSRTVRKTNTSGFICRIWDNMQEKVMSNRRPERGFLQMH